MEAIALDPVGCALLKMALSFRAAKPTQSFPPSAG